MAEGTPLTEEGLARLLKNQQKQTAPASSGVKGIDEALKKSAAELDPFSAAVGAAGKAGSAAASGVSALKDAVVSGLDSWRDLSKAGAGFNNDIIGMTTAAAGTRLPLKDFADVIKTNTSEFAGLGGSVTRGAEAFAKMSKSFFDSGATDSLKQLGYTNKELNEVLALQAVTLRGKFKDDQQRDAVAIENATKLATEMDLMAKLTGKSREAQMEQMKKNQMDMQFEAAIRLKTQGMNAEDAAKFEANARAQLQDAQMRGQGQMFKEVFATGQILSKDAATQAALNQEQANATMRQARASAVGDEKAASAAANEARAQSVKDMNNTSKLQLMALGDAGGTVSKTLNESAAAQITYVRGLEQVAAANGLDLKNKDDLAKAQKIQADEAKKAAAGQDAQGKQVDGATKAAVQLGNTVDHLRAGLTTGLLEPVRDKISPQLGRFAENLSVANTNFGGTGKGIAQATEAAARTGVEKGASSAPAGDRRTSEVAPSGPLGVIQGAGSVVGMGARAMSAGTEAVNKRLEKRATGGPVEEGEPYIVGDGGEEEIFVPKTDGEIIPKSKLTPKGLSPKSDNMAGAYASMQSMDPAKMLAQLRSQIPAGGLNINEISKDVSTTISGGGSSTIKGPDLKELSKPFEKSFAEFNTSFEDLKDLSKPFESSFADFSSSFDNVKGISKKLESSFADVSSTFDALPDFTDLFDDSFESFNTSFEDLVAKSSEDISDAMGGTKTLSAQAKIDEAIKAKEAAYEKLQRLWNEGSDEELNENHEKYAQELEEAKANLSRVIDESMGDLVSTMDDNSNDLDSSSLFDNDETGVMKEAVSAASPTPTNRGISMDSFTLGPNGLPIAKPKATSAAVPDKPAEKKASPGKAINPETGEEYTPVGKAETPAKEGAKAPASEGKGATLDDVVKSLNALNSKMGQLISTTEDGHKNVAKAAKSNSANLYAR